jgi:hypothetical protein
VKARRQHRRAVRDFPALRRRSAAHHDFEQPVIGPDIEPAVGLGDEGAPFAPDARIDNAKQHGSGREPHGISGEQVGGRFRHSGRRIGEQRNCRHSGRFPLQNGDDLSGIGTGETKIGEQHDHCGTIASAIPRRQGIQSQFGAKFTG